MMLDHHDDSLTIDIEDVAAKVLGVLQMSNTIETELVDRLIALERRVAIIEAEAQRKDDRTCR